MESPSSHTGSLFYLPSPSAFVLYHKSQALSGKDGNVPESSSSETGKHRILFSGGEERLWMLKY